jgi:hypothetical protein
MIEIPIRSKFFGLVTDKVVAYKETAKKDDSERCDVHRGDELHIDVTEKVRKLKGMNVAAIVFTVGLRQPPCWMPKEQFYRVTEETDPSERTSKPHER